MASRDVQYVHHVANDRIEGILLILCIKGIQGENFNMCRVDTVYTYILMCIVTTVH